MSSAGKDPSFRAASANLVAIGAYHSGAEAHERGLVALSMGLPYWVYAQDGNYLLLVEEVSASEVEREIRKFEEEHEFDRTDSSPGEPDYTPGIVLPFVLCVTVAAAFLFQRHEGFWVLERFNNDAGKVIVEGEWWRPVTALLLHSDLRHLLGNMAFGLWFGVLVTRSFGTWFGWSLILLSGILGNFLSAWIYFPTPHSSIGASTAVFGALGILVGNGLWTSFRDHSTKGIFSKLAPFAGGLALLGLTGAGDARTDIVSHCTGFACGLVLGLLGSYQRIAPAEAEAETGAG